MGILRRAESHVPTITTCHRAPHSQPTTKSLVESDVGEPNAIPRPHHHLQRDVEPLDVVLHGQIALHAEDLAATTEIASPASLGSQHALGVTVGDLLESKTEPLLMEMRPFADLEIAVRDHLRIRPPVMDVGFAFYVRCAEQGRSLARRDGVIEVTVNVQPAVQVVNERRRRPGYKLFDEAGGTELQREPPINPALGEKGSGMRLLEQLFDLHTVLQPRRAWL